MSATVLIDTSATARRVELPEDRREQRAVIAELVGDVVDRAVYRRDVLFHVHGDGAATMSPNWVAWALASTWRGIRLPYHLYGPVLITGPEGPFEGVSGLDDDLVEQAEHAARVAHDLAGQPADRLLEEVGVFARG